MKTALENSTANSSRTFNTPSERLLAAYIVLSLFAILYIPYFFPLPPSTSDSYVFGYNNRIGILLLLLLASLGAILARGLRLVTIFHHNSAAIPRRYLWLSLTIELVACIGVYGLALRSGPAAEAEQQINRIWLLAAGHRPYIDFDWPWGPFFLYIPKWFAALLRLSLPQAYFLFWILCSLTGVVLLYAILNRIDFPTDKKIAIFFLFLPCVVFSALNMGTNYSWVRYLCPIFFILLIYQTSRKPSITAANQARACFLAVLFTAVLLLISPEVTIAHALACIALLYPKRTAPALRRRLTAYLAMLAALALLAAVAFQAHMLDALLIDGSGGNSFPIILAPAVIFFFAAVFVAAGYLVQRARTPAINDNTIAVLVFSIPMTAAALGRCDPAHILLNGIGFFLALFFYASTSTRWWTFTRNAFVICFLVLPSIGSVFFLVRSFIQPAPPAFPAHAGIAALYTHQPSSDNAFEAPFGYTPQASGFYVSPQIDYGFYDGILDASTPLAYRRKIDELARRPQRPLLLHRDIFDVCEVRPDIDSALISILFTFPYTARAAHTDSVRKPLCDYIHAHYNLAVPATPQNFQYELWTPKP
jgi:hypothetical protein